MKNIINNRFYKHFFSALMVCVITGSTHGMKRLKEEYAQAKSSTTEESTPRIQKMKNIWIKTSDDKLITMPEWQVDQVKVLQMLLVNQKGTNSKKYPINASHVIKNNGKLVDTSSSALNLIKTALETSKNPKDLPTLYSVMKPEEYKTLINTAGDLEANALFASLASAILPSEVQTRINFTILIPIVDYFIKCLGNPIRSLASQDNIQPINRAPVIKISPNGQHVLLSDRYNINASSILDLNAQKERAVTNAITNLNFSPASTYVIAHTPNRSYYIVYDYISAKKAFEVHNSNLITFSPNDEYCLFNSTNNPGIINGKAHKDTDWIDLPPLQGHTTQVNTIQFSSDGNYIVSGSNDTYPNNLILWDGNSFEKITSFSYEGPWSAHLHPVIRAHFTPDNKYIISTDNQENTIIWDVVSKKPIKKLDIQNQVLWEVNNSKPTSLKNSIRKFTYSPQWLHTYLNDKHYQKILYELGINHTFNHSVLPIDNKAISTLVTNLERKTLTCKQYSSIPPFDFRKNTNVIPNNGYDLEKAVESSNSKYLLLAYEPGYITLTLTDEKKSLTIPVQPYNTIKFSPKNDYIIITHPPTVPKERMCTWWKITDLKMMLDISYDSSVTLSQSRFLYRMYIAHMNRVKVIIDKNDPDYAVYKSLSTDLQKLVDKFLPFEIASDKAQETLQKS